MKFQCCTVGGKVTMHAKKKKKKSVALRDITAIEENAIKNLQNKPSPPEVPEPSMMLPSPGTRARNQTLHLRLVRIQNSKI